MQITAASKTEKYPVQQLNALKIMVNCIFYRQDFITMTEIPSTTHLLFIYDQNLYDNSERSQKNDYDM